MAVAQLQDEGDWQQPLPKLDLFPVAPKIRDNDLFAFIPDFFDWLENDWRLPTYSSDGQKPLPSPLTLTRTSYTIADLALIYGCSCNCIYRALRRHRVSHSRRSNKGKGQCGIYEKQDLLPLLEQWEWERVLRVIDVWWLRFFPPACGTCRNCRDAYIRFPTTQQIYCAGNVPLTRLRSIFTDFIEEVRRLGSVAAWWHVHHTDRWGGYLCSSHGILLIYLLDRRLLSLSDDELVRLEPLCNKSYQDLTRLWHHRRPEEYVQFRQALSAAHYGENTQERALTVVGLLVLLKYGLPGLTELGRVLSSEELQQICRERRLVTMHLGQGVFLPHPLCSDVCVGHVALDDIRHFFWQYAMRQGPRQGKQQWDLGPRGFRQMTVGAIEQAISAPMYDGRGIVSRRPEVERRLMNPWRILSEGKLTNTGYALLPTPVQKHIVTYLTYRHQEHHRELTSLRSDVDIFMRFFTWARVQGKLVRYPHWTRQQAQEIFRSYAAYASPEVKVNTRVGWFWRLASFFSTLEDLDIPVPPGYRLLYTFEKEDKPPLRVVPTEHVMDRIFQDGVRALTYDPLARLALTIQYYCGTRVTETCDLHLFCILEDSNGHAYLLIPKGKSKEERPFPIVELGMGPLLEYMDEIVAMRLFPDGTSRTLGKTNVRYLSDDPERARDWHYLFDRVPSADGLVKQRGRLSDDRVRSALQEALRIAAKSNPDGLFQEATYHSTCAHRRRQGQKCRYFAAQEGITICPCCSSSLSGKLGDRCHHILNKDFVCDGVARHGEMFCPKCDTPLADFFPITSHVFRHNSVSRAHRSGVSVTHNMRLHGHQTVSASLLGRELNPL